MQFLETKDQIPGIRAPSTDWTETCANWKTFYPEDATYLRDSGVSSQNCGDMFLSLANVSTGFGYLSLCWVSSYVLVEQLHSEGFLGKFLAKVLDNRLCDSSNVF